MNSGEKSGFFIGSVFYFLHQDLQVMFHFDLLFFKGFNNGITGNCPIFFMYGKDMIRIVVGSIIPG
jgi:hypothetical protein